MVECPDCHQGWSLLPEEVDHARNDMRAFLGSKWHCPKCGKETSTLEAIIQGLITSNSLVSTFAVGNILLCGKAAVTVGIENVVELSQEVPLVLSVNLTLYGKFARLSWIPASKDKFIIVSSAMTTTTGQNPEKYAKLGETVGANWALSGRSNWSDLDVPVWQIVLI